MTIYIPIQIEKELPEEHPDYLNVSKSVFVLYGAKPIVAYYNFISNKWFGDVDEVVQFPSVWLKPIEVESLIEHVQNDVMADDIKEIINQSILKFLK